MLASDVRKKKRVAMLSIISNSTLVTIKIIAGILGGSVSVISEAIHSGIDLLASVIAWFSVRISSRPPDKQHPYGHGKFENVSGVIEAALILVAASWIIIEAIKRMINPGELEMPLIGMGVMAFSAIANFFVSRMLYKVGKQTDSIALEADALHLKTDVYTSLGVGVGLLIIHFTGWHQADPYIAIAVAMLICFESYKLMKKAFAPLVDVSLSESEVNLVESCIREIAGSDIEYRDLRTRSSGHLRYVDFILCVPGNYSVKEAHELCDNIDHLIESKLNHTEVTIHVEPAKC